MITTNVFKRVLISGLRVLILIVFLIGLLPVSQVNAEDSGWALDFDGIDDYVSLGKTEIVLGPNWKDTKSFSMWIKPMGVAQICIKDNVPDVGYCDQILTNQPHFFGIARGIVSGQDRIWIWNYSATGTEKIGILYSQNEWVHVSFVHANGVLKAYRNGNLIGQIASGTTFIDTGILTTNFQLGAFFRPELIQAYEGLIDEVRIYNTELAQQTIIDKLRTSLVGNEAGLVAYYKMSDGSGLVLTDDSINTFDGTLQDGINPGTDRLYPEWVISDAWSGPIANDQTISVNEDSPVAITLTGSPATSGGTLTYHLGASPQHGFLSGTIPNYIYTPESNFNGADSFSFYVRENDTTDSGLATVFIDVVPVNDSPVAVNDSYSVPVSSILDVAVINGILNNDTDIDGDLLTAVLVNNVQHGTLNLSSNGSFTYTPTSSYSGTDTFTYRANDGTVDSAFATVTINVVLGNVGPVAVNDSYSVSMNSILNVAVLNGVLNNDTDINGDTLTAVLVNNVQHGTLNLISNGSFTYTPTPSYSGTDTFTYKANDGIVDSANATVTISVFQANFKLYLPFIKK